MSYLGERNLSIRKKMRELRDENYLITNFLIDEGLVGKARELTVLSEKMISAIREYSISLSETH